MKATAGQIESKVFQLLKDSSININGKIYKEGTRPIDSKKEDAVVTFQTGTDAQIQSGIVVINVYVPDIDNGQNKGVKVKDILRCNEIEALLQSFSESVSVSGEYKFNPDKIIKTYKEDGIEQHFVNLRLKFKRSTY
mgnify:CR=1 FL=1|jgi:hypothetical protein